MPDVLAVLRASTSDFTAKMAEARGEMDATEKSGSSSLSKLSTIGKAALLGIGTAAVGVGIAAVDMADKYENAHATLVTALKAAGTSWDANKASIASTEQQATHFGFTMSQVEAALAAGVISTQNYAEAHRNLAVAIQLAAAKHVDLQTAMQMVDKAATGNLRALKAMGIDLPIVTSNALKLKQAHEALQAAQLKALAVLRQYPDALDAASKHHAAYQTALDGVLMAQTKVNDQQQASHQILDALSKRLAGQASAAADTFSGRLAAAKAQGENLLATLGLKLIPVLETLISVVMTVVNWLEQHRAVAAALGIVIGGALVAAIAAYTAGMVSAAAATIAATWPVLAVIAAIGLVIAAIVLLATHWKQVWTDIKNWVQDGVNFIKDHFLIIMAIPIIGWMLELAANWKSVWEVIQTTIQTAWSIIQPIFNFIKTYGTDYVVANIIVMRDIWNAAWAAVSTTIGAAKDAIGVVIAAISFAIGTVKSVINDLETAWNTVWSALSSAVQTMWSIVKPIFDAISSAASTVANAVGGVKNAISGVASVGGSVLSTATFGLLASGGPAQAGTPYIVGEAGPELFIPNSSGIVVPNGGTGGGVGGTPLLGGAAGGGGTLEAHLHINGVEFAQGIFPDLWTVMLQNKRAVVNLSLD